MARGLRVLGVDGGTAGGAHEGEQQPYPHITTAFP